MKSPKTLAGIFILCIAIVVASFILINNVNNSQNQSGKSSVLDKLGLSNWGNNNISDNNTNLSSSGNLTENFANILAEQIKNQGQNPDKLLSDQYLENVMSGLQTSNNKGYHPKVNALNLNISQDVSPSAQVAYLDKLKEISQKNSLSKTSSDILNDVLKNDKGDSAKAASDFYGKLADEYAKVQIPKNWVDFHKAFLSHYYSAQSIYLIISDYKNDPMKAYLAVQALSKLDQSSTGIQVLIMEGIKKNHLSF